MTAYSIALTVGGVCFIASVINAVIRCREAGAEMDARDDARLQTKR